MATETKTEAKVGAEPKPEQRWVYQAGFDHTFIIRPSMRKTKIDEYGNEVIINTKPVKVFFVARKLVVDENLAHNLKLPVKTIVEMIEAQPQFGRTVFCIHSPEKSASVEEVAKIDKEIKEAHKGPQVVRGTRSLASKG